MHVCLIFTFLGMDMKRILFTACAVISLIFVSFLVIRNSGKTAQETLVVGTASGYAPFVSINAQGEYEGFDIDVAQAVAKQLGKKLILKDLGSLPTLFCALEQGSIDVIIWALSITNERKNSVAMVQYQGEGVRSYPLIFWQQAPINITSFADVIEYTICVEPGSTQEKVLNKYPRIIQKPVDKITDAVLAIQYGKADAALVEPAIAKTVQTSFPNELKIINMPLDIDDQEFGNGIAIRKDQKTLIDDITKAIDALRKQGVIAQLEKKWGLV